MDSYLSVVKGFECVGKQVEGVSEWGGGAEFAGAEEVGKDVGGYEGGVEPVAWR